MLWVKPRDGYARPTSLSEAANASWVIRNVSWLKAFMRVTFGAVWLVDGSLKFQPGAFDYILGMIQFSGTGQPAWLQPWFNFWANTALGDARLVVYGTGVAELVLGTALVLGFMRKITYIGGIVLSLLIWAVPEGFGGPYGGYSVDIGTGIIYSFAFLALIIINAGLGPSKYSIDRILERRLPFWKRLAEFA